VKNSKRNLTTLLCIIPLLLSCSTQYQGKQAQHINEPAEETELVEKHVTISINIPENTDPALFLYKNPATRLEVLDFYNTLTGNAAITNAIVKNAVQYGIPFNLAFALAHGESDFNRWAVNKNAVSVDRGLFQLNSTTFPQLTETQCFDPEINAKYALRHFRWCLDQGGNEVVGIAIYNAGRGRVELGGTPRITLDHINNILGYKIDLERRLIEWVNSNPSLQVCIRRPEKQEQAG
jgi:hypothetical protein